MIVSSTCFDSNSSFFLMDFQNNWSASSLFLFKFTSFKFQRCKKNCWANFYLLSSSATFCKFLFLRKDKLATNWNFKLTVNLNEAFMRHQLTTSLFIFHFLFVIFQYLYFCFCFCFCFSRILLDQIEAVCSWRWRKIILICFPDADISDEWNFYVIVSCRAW